jgi:hypothetical protein
MWHFTIAMMFSRAMIKIDNAPRAMIGETNKELQSINIMT